MLYGNMELNTMVSIVHETLEFDFRAPDIDNQVFLIKKVQLKKILPASCENQIP